MSLPPIAPSQDWIVFDLETTGLRPQFDDIIQIAAVRMQNGKRVESDSFFSYVNPGRPIPAWIAAYTGVTDADVRTAPPAGEVLKRFARFVGGATLVAHNGHRFDMPFLEAACRRCNTGHRPVAYHDSLALSRLLWGHRGVGHGLDAVLQRLGLNTSGLRRHDARGDVDLLARAIEIMWERLAASGRLELRCYEGRLPPG